MEEELQSSGPDPVPTTPALEKSHAPVENSKNTLDAVIDGVLSMARKPSAISLAQSQLAQTGLSSSDSSPSKPKRQVGFTQFFTSLKMFLFLSSLF